MPQLVWNEVSHHYTLVRDPLRLELTLWQYDSDVALQLFVAALPEPVLRYTLQGCPGIRLIDDKRGTFLEFAAANWIKPQIKLEPFVYIT